MDDPIAVHTFKSSQLYDVGKSENDPVGKPLKHSSADEHATGEAKYIDDMPKMQHEVFLGFVMSTVAHANIVSVDPAQVSWGGCKELHIMRERWQQNTIICLEGTEICRASPTINRTK